MNPDRPALRQRGLSQFASRYQALFCDIWGVVHNGVTPHSEAVDALVRFRQAGGHVVLVSNASRPSPYIKLMLDRMGVPAHGYDAIITSGDATRELIAQFSGRKVHHVGPHSDNPLFEGLDVTKTEADEAAAIVVTGLNNADHHPADYADAIEHWMALGLPMICANPDKVVEIGGRIEYCPGALADIYAQMGGEVRMAGKPFPAIYDAAAKRLGEIAGQKIERSALLAIGDSIRTDAAGAAGFGIDFLFVTGSVHAEELDAFGEPDEKTIRDLVAPSGVHMVAHMPRLFW